MKSKCAGLIYFRCLSINLLSVHSDPIWYDMINPTPLKCQATWACVFLWRYTAECEVGNVCLNEIRSIGTIFTKRMSSFNKFAKPSMQMKMLVILLVSCYRHDGVSICHLAYFSLVLQHCLALIVLQNCYNMSYFKRLLQNGDRVEFSHSYLVEQKTNPIYILNSWRWRGNNDFGSFYIGWITVGVAGLKSWSLHLWE